MFPWVLGATPGGGRKAEEEEQEGQQGAAVPGGFCALCVPRAGRALSFTARMCAAGHAGAVLLSSAVVSGN